MKIEQTAVTLPEPDLLVMLAWYLLVIRAQDGTSDTVAATAGTTAS